MVFREQTAIQKPPRAPWADTTDVGCGLAVCDSGISGFLGDNTAGTILVCNCGPAGNGIGEFLNVAATTRTRLLESSSPCSNYSHTTP